MRGVDKGKGQERSRGFRPVRKRERAFDRETFRIFGNPNLGGDLLVWGCVSNPLESGRGLSEPVQVAQ